MKREYGEEKKHDNNSMFSKRHHQLEQKLHHHHYQPPPPQLHHFTTTGKSLPTSDEEDDRHRNGFIQYYSKVQQQEEEGHSFLPPPPNDGATIEVVRRPRGRPPGSKNKPKQPSSIITKLEYSSDQPSMSPYILELPAGVDIIESTTRFCEKRNVSLCILSGHGVVTNITLKQPSTNPSSSTVIFHGSFDILSLSATIFASGNNTRATGLAGNGNGLFTLSVAVGPQGQVVGGIVVEPLISAATIYLIATTIHSPSLYRLHHDDEEEEEEDTAKNGGRETHNQESASGRMQVVVVEEQCGINNSSLYNNYDDHQHHNASDVIWAPIARQPHQIPPYNN